MTELIRFPTEDGGEVLVAAAGDHQPGMSDASAGQRTIDALTSYEGALEKVRQIAAQTLGKLRDLPVRPDEVMVELGVTFSAETGVVIAKSSMDGNLRVRLTWKSDDATAGGTAGD